jgi:hypothetical protein
MYLVDSVFPAPLSPEGRRERKGTRREKGERGREERERERERERGGGGEKERKRERGRERTAEANNQAHYKFAWMYLTADNDGLALLE